MRTLTKKEFYNLIKETPPKVLLFKTKLEEKYNKKYPGLRKGAVSDQLSRFTASGHLEYLGRPGVYRTVADKPLEICDQIISLASRLKEEL